MTAVISSLLSCIRITWLCPCQVNFQHLPLKGMVCISLSHGCSAWSCDLLWPMKSGWKDIVSIPCWGFKRYHRCLLRLWFPGTIWKNPDQVTTVPSDRASELRHRADANRTRSRKPNLAWPGPAWPSWIQLLSISVFATVKQRCWGVCYTATLTNKSWTWTRQRS